MTTTTSPNLTLVLGAGGTTGRRVASRLAARGVPTRLGSRTGQPPFEWADDGTWPGVLAGVSAAYLVYYPDLVAPGAVERVRGFADLAVASGVGRLVLLSGRGERAAQQAEQAVLAVDATVTIVRLAFFAQNFSEKGFEHFIRAGTVAVPAPPVGEPFVDADDIADVVVTALTEDGHAGRIYEVTGPRLLRFDEAVADIAAACGRPIDFQRITATEFIDGLVAQGLPVEEGTGVRRDQLRPADWPTRRGSGFDGGMQVIKDGRAWRIGTAADVAWIAGRTTHGVSITAASRRSSTPTPPSTRRRASPPPTTSAPSSVPSGTPPTSRGGWATWRPAPTTSSSRSAQGVAVLGVAVRAGRGRAGAGAHLADRSHARGDGSLPDLFFPADRSWLVSALWDDTWTCIGGSDQLIDTLQRDPLLSARRVEPDEDALPPGLIRE